MHIDSLKQLSKVCFDQRKFNQLTLEDVASFSGLSPRLIGEFERSQRDSIAFEFLETLLQLLGVTLLIGSQPASQLQATIKLVRKKSGLTQLDTALLLNLSFTTYKRLEQGGNIATNKVFQACFGLGIPWQINSINSEHQESD